MHIHIHVIFRSEHPILLEDVYNPSLEFSLEIIHGHTRNAFVKIRKAIYFETCKLRYIKYKN